MRHNSHSMPTVPRRDNLAVPSRHWILAAICTLILYGSLFPFDFRFPDSFTMAIRALLSSSALRSSLGDILGNIALFVPLGFAAVAGSSWSPLRSSITTLIGALALAVGAQVGQIYIPSRTPLVADIVWNLVGACIGSVAGRMVTRAPAFWPLRSNPRLTITGCISLLWIGSALLPFVPSTSLQNLRDNLRPLLHTSLDAGQLAFHCAGVLVAGLTLRRLVPPRTIYIALAALTVGMLVMRSVMIDSKVTASLVGGLLIGTWLTIALLKEQCDKHALVTMLVCLATISLRALLPLTLRTQAGEVNYIPFAGWLNQSMLNNVREFLESGLLYSCIIGLAMISSGRVIGTTLVLSCWVALLEAAQLWLDGRTPDVTEPLLVVLIGLMLRAIRLPRRPDVMPDMYPTTPATVVPLTPNTHWLIALLLLLIVGATAIQLILTKPGLPYNVRELFRRDGHFLVLCVFVAAMLWLGAGSRWMAGYVTTSTRPWLAWPVANVCVGLVLLALLRLSVTEESIGDLAGSKIIYRAVTINGMWGEWARDVFAQYISAELVDFVERAVRLTCLFGPLITISALVWFGSDRTTAAAQWGVARSKVLLWSLPWLFICKVVAFDWPSTDNISELIAAGGPWGLGGGVYLYGLTGILGANAVLLARVRIKDRGNLTLVALTTLLLPTVGYSMLNLGLEQNIHKYGIDFSGVQFLMGPDRKHALHPWELAVRWAVVQCGLTTLIAAGMCLANHCGRSIAALRSHGVDGDRNLRDFGDKRAMPPE